MKDEKMKFRGIRLKDKLFLAYIRKVPDHPFKGRIVNTINDILFDNSVQLKGANASAFYFSTREQTGKGIIKQDNYEPLTMQLAGDILRDGGTLVDVGANMGIFSIYLSKIKGVSVYAIEPSPAIFSMLLKNLDKNDAGNVTPLNIGLSYEDSFGYMYNEGPKNLGTMKVINEQQPNAHLVRLCTLFDLLAHLQIKTVKLLKIDVEGFEMNVLKGLFNKENTVYPENIIMEFNELVERTGYTRPEALDYITSLGYTAFNMDGDPYTYGGNLPESNLLFKYKAS